MSRGRAGAARLGVTVVGRNLCQVGLRSRKYFVIRVGPSMKPCISQVTTLSTPFEDDLPSYTRAGFQAIEIWLTKLETYLESHSIVEARGLLDDQGSSTVSAAFQGGLPLSHGAESEADWEHVRRRLALLHEGGVPHLRSAAR